MSDMPVQDQDPTTGTGPSQDTDPVDNDPQSPDPTGSAAGTDADTVPDPEGADALGDPGKKALDAMKARWKAERDKRRELERRLEELESSRKPASDDQPDPEEIRRQVTRDALAKANERILKSEIKAAAAGRLADPSDALAYLDLSTFEVDENGEVDVEEIREAIDDLLTRKPYLAATSRPRFQGSGDGGAARKVSGPSQLTREDLQKMTPEQIVQAKREGRLKRLLSGE